MNISTKQFKLIGGILFWIGLILIIYSWIQSFPLSYSPVPTPTFYQFYPSIWPGILLSLIGLLTVGLHTKKPIHLIVLSCTIPLILYAYKSFFSYLPSSDAGNVRALFEIVKTVGLDSSVDPYFQYPVYFLSNHVSDVIIDWSVNSIGLFTFFLYGILIAMFLFLYLRKFDKNHRLAFLGIFVYFIGVFLFINYQWVPQTLALVFFLMLLYLYEKNGLVYRILQIIVFTSLVFTHAFIPVMFLIFYGIYSVKHKRRFFLFILFCWIYSLVLFYHTTAFLPDIITVFRDSVLGVGDYQELVTRSLTDPIGLLSQIISLVNRFLIPFIWVVVSFGFLILFLRKKLHLDTIFLAITGGIYLVGGVFFSILGTRAFQIVFIPLLHGIKYYQNNWRKYFIIFLVIIISLSVFLPMRKSYDNYFYQLEEEAKASNFLAEHIPITRFNHIAVSQISHDYVLKKMLLFHRNNPDLKYPGFYRPHTQEFYEIFNQTMRSRSFLLYNTNLGKHVSAYGVSFSDIEKIVDQNLLNNKLYQSGETYIMGNY